MAIYLQATTTLQQGHWPRLRNYYTREIFVADNFLLSRHSWERDEFYHPEWGEVEMPSERRDAEVWDFDQISRPWRLEVPQIDNREYSALKVILYCPYDDERPRVSLVPDSAWFTTVAALSQRNFLPLLCVHPRPVCVWNVTHFYCSAGCWQKYSQIRIKKATLWGKLSTEREIYWHKKSAYSELGSKYSTREKVNISFAATQHTQTAAATASAVKQERSRPLILGVKCPI